MRYLPVILEHVMTIIPKAKEDLRADLQRVLDSSRYAPPESSYNWVRAAAILESYLGEDRPHGGWALRVFNVMTGIESVPGAEPTKQNC